MPKPTTTHHHMKIPGGRGILNLFFYPGGEISGRTYAVCGFTMFFLKWNLDRIIAADIFGSSWPWAYMFPTRSLGDLSSESLTLLFWMGLSALPFVYTGIVLTAKRLRALSMPQKLVLLFFVPVVNLLFFLVLCFARRPETINSSPTDSVCPRWLPRSRWGRSAMVMVLWLPLTAIAMFALQDFGWGLFLGVPFGLGFTAAILERASGNCLSVRSGVLTAFYAMLLLFSFLFLLALEGLICIAMSFPIATPVCILGAVVGSLSPRAGRSCFAIFVGTTLFMGFEHVYAPKPPTFSVVSSIEIDAPPEKVWEQVVTFSELPPVEDWLFKTGIAYPVRAEIDGSGLGAVRHCVFSTGSFVEPITVWDSPRELRFGVSQQPSPMQSWTFYKFLPTSKKVTFHSEEGQFLLKRLPEGVTRLQGTTWYHNELLPAGYWKLWSDFIIHRIHVRVLRHIKAESEKS